MKKALAVLLSVLVIFSSFAVMTFAQEGETDLITVKFVVDGNTVKTVQVKSGEILTPYVPENPVKEDTDTAEYTFKGWKDEAGNLWQQSTLPTPDGSDNEVIFTAEFMEETIVENETFFSFIASIFERINMLFEYFAKIFEDVFASV